MDIEIFRQYCLSKKGTTEDTPFDEVTLCLRVMNKIFAILPLDAVTATAALKCDPDYAIELREKYPEVQPGFHMNKKHWNTVELEGSLDAKMLQHLVDHSYDLVVKTLKKTERVNYEL